MSTFDIATTKRVYVFSGRGGSKSGEALTWGFLAPG